MSFNKEHTNYGRPKGYLPEDTKVELKGEKSIIDELRYKANKLPLLPGVYLMLDEHGEVIYVGKAKKLKNRVTSYFRGEHEPKTTAMIEKVRNFNVIVAASEFEALVLENSLIKRHQPHYNILLRDDKTYPFIRLETKAEYPTFCVVNNISNDGVKYFGPFGSRGTTFNIIDTVLKALLLPTCSKKFPRDIGKSRPCLNYHLGTCSGYCTGSPSKEEYNSRISEAEMILSGKTKQLRLKLESEMMKAADEMCFEEAAKIRDRIRAIDGLSNRQRVISAAMADMDAIGFFRGAKSCFAVLHYSEGQLAGKDYNLLSEPLEDDKTAISALLRQYYSIRGAWPKQILLPMELEDAEEISQMLSDASGHKVSLEVPKRGDRRFYVEKAMLNAREECIRATTAQQRRLKTLEWLQQALKLEKLPRRIEAFDISNTGNFGMVASMTVFVNGKPLKRDYRKFRIKQLTSQDDYNCMREVLTRRFNRYLSGDEKFSKLPDLLLIDGGDVHAGIAERVLRELDIKLPVLGMVKDDRHRTRALIYSNSEEIGLTGNPSVFALIGNIQEETHRFAIEFHRSLRSKTIGSTLEEIKGVGEVRRNELLKHFKSLKAIKNATYDELCEVVPKNTAKAVFNHFHQDRKNNSDISKNKEET